MQTICVLERIEGNTLVCQTNQEFVNVQASSQDIAFYSPLLAADKLVLVEVDLETLQVTTSKGEGFDLQLEMNNPALVGSTDIE